MIKYIEQGRIDRRKWDACVEGSKAGLIYALSWYLDLTAPGWGGLVEDDYRAVMPLPMRRKYGITYLFQPFFSQQLGIFSRSWVNAEKTAEFLEAIPSFVNYVRINMNFTNDLNNLPFRKQENSNYELRLGRNYQDISDAYSDNTKRNIRKSLPFVEITENLGIPDLIRLKRENTPEKRPRRHYEWMNCLIDRILSMGNGRLIGATIDHELVAAAFFVIFAGRICYLIPVSGEQGKNSRAMFGIVDHVIGSYAGTGLVLDFEGSNIPGVARFFAGFGARESKYQTITLNRLPFLLKHFKK